LLDDIQHEKPEADSMAEGVTASELRHRPCMYLQNVLRAFPTCAVAADFDPLHGLVKLWHFGCYTFDQLCDLCDGPEAMSNYRPFFERHCFSRVFCTGIDLKKRSMNVYFNLREGGAKGVEDVHQMFSDLGFDAPGDQHILKYITGPGSFAMTFRWNSAECERICFYVVPQAWNDREEPAASPRIPSSIASFMDDCALPHADDREREGEQNCTWRHKPSCIHPANSCFVSCSFAKTVGSLYFKHESDWLNSYHEFLGRCVDFTRRNRSHHA
jgi:hypothetical protein